MLLEQILNRIAYSIWSLTTIFKTITVPKENITITYSLYTPENPEPTIFNSIDEIVINPDYELKILCHGWNYRNYSTQWYNFTIEEYIKKGDVNIVSADYSYAVNTIRSYEATKYANHIGTQIGNLILNLSESKGIQFSKVHVLGHLLGAHIAGVAGETVYKETGKYIDRITGMDPIYVGYIRLETDGRLSRNDAVFVDVIHANSGDDPKELGRIDFFGYPYMARCSYDWNNCRNMGPVYYANSINNVDVMECTKCPKKKYFRSMYCNNNITAVLGEYVDRDRFGRFVVKESDISKYVCNNRSIETTTSANVIED